MAEDEVAVEFPSEEDKVTGWRMDVLVQAGYDHDAALRLAVERTVDLHRACDLLARAGSVELALRILL
ncbi:MAG: hypothetical protein HY323_05605 [Betaproteobacteria bacterium]|nr:hypothetical protein [Betaproteobacteria bacterium]